jgi:hypothetical protein
VFAKPSPIETLVGVDGETRSDARNVSLSDPWVLAVVATPTEIEGFSEPSVARG